VNHPADREPSLVGAVISRRYRLTRKLGTGGMGVVYAGERVSDGAPVALKLLLSEFHKDESVLTRFLDEARATERLVHPNILRIFETGRAEDGTPYMAMELLEGVPLSAYTQNGGRVPLAQGITILQGILAGLQAAHAQGIIHRDLKPDNVFLARDRSGQFVVKLLDFGIAKVMDAAGGMGAKTRTGVLLGTPAYMSPEQIKSTKDVDARADLWSAGVMFYEMLTGRIAFPAPTEYARLFNVLNEAPEPIDRVDPALAPVAAFVARAMQKERDARYQTALEMSRGLAAVQAQMGERAPQPMSAPMPLSHLPDVPQVAGVPGAQPAAAPEPPSKGPGGTLTSRPSHTVSDPPPQIRVVGGGGTLPSNDLPVLDPVSHGPPRLSRAGVSAAMVVVLVVGALLAGLCLGYAMGRMR
jgi:serine/threonine-protein kinase